MDVVGHHSTAGRERAARRPHPRVPSHGLIQRVGELSARPGGGWVELPSGAQVRVGPGLDGGMSFETGFMPTHDTTRPLPPAFDSWEAAQRRLPAMVRGYSARSELDQLPLLDASKLPDDFLRRASLILGALAHAYHFHDRAEGSVEVAMLPEAILRPWQNVCERLGRTNTGRTNADYILNLVTFEGAEPRLTVSCFDDEVHEERLTPGTQAAMEVEFARAFPALVGAQQAIMLGDNAGLARALERIADVIVSCQERWLHLTPQEGHRGVDPIVWERSFLKMGAKVFPDEPDNSGVDSPIFHAVDAFLGRAIVRDADELRAQQEGRRQGMPPTHRALMEALEAPELNVRRYVEASGDLRLAAAFRTVLSAYADFLELHRKKAIGAIGLISPHRPMTFGMRSSGGDVTSLPTDELLQRQMATAIRMRVGDVDGRRSARIGRVEIDGRSALVRVEFDAPAALRAGDRLEVWPENSPQDVDRVLARAGVEFWGPKATEIRQRVQGGDLHALDGLEGTALANRLDHDLPPLTPRMYSIGRIERNADGLATAVHLTVGLVDQPGLGARFLRDGAGQEVTVRVAPAPLFRLPSDPGTPLLLLAQGSGIGPFIGFVEERGEQTGPISLIVGARRLADVPYVERLTRFSENKPLEVTLALSEEGRVVRIAGGELTSTVASRPHVDDVLRESGSEVRTLMANGGHAYICGGVPFGLGVRGELERLIAPTGSRPRVQPMGRIPDVSPYTYAIHTDLFTAPIDRQALPGISVAEVATHNRFHDLWAIFGDGVYDLTSYVGLHPGGAKTLMESAGTRGDRRFAQIHDGSLEVAALLQHFKIGEVLGGSPFEEQLETLVRIQNQLHISMQYPESRRIPFYVVERGLENAIESLRVLVTVAGNLASDASRAATLEERRTQLVSQAGLLRLQARKCCGARWMMGFRSGWLRAIIGRELGLPRSMMAIPLVG